MEPKTAVERIVSFVRQTVRQAGAKGVVVGLSGGVDSAVVAALCVQALGKDNVLALLMPERHQSSQAAERYAQKLAILHEQIVISPAVEEFEKICGHKTGDKVALGNLRPRARMAILYYHANLLNYLVAGTGNKSELLAGYFTKYGDGGVDFLPIGDLYKGQVRQLAEFLAVPEEIILAPPTAGLWPGQTDEGEMGLSYELLDQILAKLHDEKKSAAQAAKELAVDEKTVDAVVARMNGARHKLEMPPVCKI